MSRHSKPKEKLPGSVILLFYHWVTLFPMPSSPNTKGQGPVREVGGNHLGIEKTKMFPNFENLNSNQQGSPPSFCEGHFAVLVTSGFTVSISKDSPQEKRGRKGAFLEPLACPSPTVPLVNLIKPTQTKSKDALVNGESLIITLLSCFF